MQDSVMIPYKILLEKLAVVVHVLSNTQNLVISCPSFVEIGKPKEMYQEFQRTCTAIVLYLNCLVTIPG